MRGAVQTDGIRELRRDLRKIDKDLDKGVQDGLKAAGQIVADEAERRAPRGGRPLPRQGRRPRKRLHEVIRSKVRGNAVFVTANVTQASKKYPQGYRFGRRFEYGDFNRPFLRPALDAKRNEVVERLGDVTKDIERRFSRGK